MKNKDTYFSMIRAAIKETKELYKQQMEEKKRKQRLLSNKSDWSMIEYYIQKCNENPDLRVTIRLYDGTTINMNTYRPEKKSIDSMLNDITIEPGY